MPQKPHKNKQNVPLNEKKKKGTMTGNDSKCSCFILKWLWELHILLAHFNEF